MNKLTRYLMIIVKSVPIALLCSIAVIIAFWSLYALTGHYDKNTFLFWIGVILFLIITWGISKDELMFLNWELIKNEEQLQGGNMKSSFMARKQEKTFCSKCGKPVHLLSDHKRQDSPKFYICFKCESIGQIGVGEVSVSDE